ncbi:MAG: patatin [Actinomycetota bacterium]|nr:patatin [Actinomycetota bacterium]
MTVRRLVLFVGASTALAGAVQFLWPGLVLDLLDARSNTDTRMLFSIVGMFMAVIGAALVHALVRGEGDAERVVELWAGVQKIGAFVCVSLAVSRGVFSSLGWLIAVNDLGSGALILWHRRRSPR